MRVCLIKLNGWPDTFNERIEVLCKYVDEVILIKPRNANPSTEPSSDIENLTHLPLWPSRPPILESSLTMALFFGLWIIGTILAFLWYRIRRGPVTVVHSIGLPLGTFCATVISIVVRVPVVASVRGLHQVPSATGELNNTTMSTQVISMFLEWSIPVSLAWMDHIIVKSSHQIDYLNRFERLTPIPKTAVPTGVDFTMFDSDRDLDLAALPDELLVPNQDRPVIAYIGRLTTTKGVDTILTHIDKISNPDVDFLFVGEFQSPSFETDFKKAIQQNQNADRIRLYDKPLPFNQMPAFFAAVDSIMLFSKPGGEGVPRVLQEAYVMETPIIAADVAGIREEFTDLEGCILIPRDDAAAFENAVSKSLTTCPDRTKVRDRFDIKDNYKSYVEVYESLTTE